MPIKFNLPAKSYKDVDGQVITTGGYNKTGLLSQTYTLSSLSHTPLTKAAQFTGSGANVIWTQPMFFSPLHTPQNWQIASKRREQYQWSYICDNKTPCYITTYDGSLKLISEFFDEATKPTSSCIRLIEQGKATLVQDGHGNISIPDKTSKRKVKKKANKIKALGLPDHLHLTNDHNCIVIKLEDIKCKKSKWNKKKCVYNHFAPTCERYKCEECYDKEYKISTVKARNINKGDHVLVPFNTDIIPSIIKTNEQARYAGHLAADGSVSEERKSVRICMGDNEKDFVFPTIKNVHESMGGNSNLINVSTIQEVRTSKKTILDFAFGLVKGKFSNKKFTDQVTLLDPKLQLHVIGAYIQSDGSYNKANSCVEITTYSPHLANQLLLMCFRCGILARTNKQPISSSSKTFKTDNEFRYIVNISSSDLPKIAEYVPGKLSDVNVKKRNDNRRFFWKNFVVSPVVSNESYDYDGYVYDVRVPGTYTVTANGIATHQSRFYYENESKVAAGVDFYVNFPLNGFKLECKSKKIVQYYEQLSKKLKLNHWLRLIAHEYFLLGDVFPFLEIDCPQCKGKGYLPDGIPCNHPGGSIKRIIILNPDWIDVQSNVLATEPVISLVPDDEIRMIVQRKQPKEIYNKLDPETVKRIAAGIPIPLSNRCVSHIKHNASPYGVYGTSLLRRMFTVLAYKTKLMTANWIVAERLILPVRVVKIGDKDRPASPNDITDVANQLSAVSNDPNLTLVTHHAFDYDWIGATSKIHNITKELEEVGKEILDGFMLNQALLNGEAAAYSSAQVGVEVMIRRLESWRSMLAEWVETNIFLPVAMMQGFIDEEKTKELKDKTYLYPTIKWNDLQLRDTSSLKQMLMQLHDKQLISSQTLLETFDIDYDQEIQRIRDEQIVVGMQGQMMGAGGGMGGGMGGMPMPGGGMPGAEMGGMQGADMGMGGMPGADMGGAPGMGMGAPAGGAPMGAAGAPMPGFKVEKRGKGQKPEDLMQAPKPTLLKLTNLEQKMYKLLMNMNLPYKTFAQYKVAVAGQQQPFVIDFAIPDLGVGIETDGKKWHEQVENKAKDGLRDRKLAGIGWRILRFKEKAIDEQMDTIQKVITDNIRAAAKSRKKAAETDEEFIKIASIIEGKREDEIVYIKESLEQDIGDMFIIGTE